MEIFQLNGIDADYVEATPKKYCNTTRHYCVTKMHFDTMLVALTESFTKSDFLT